MPGRTTSCTGKGKGRMVVSSARIARFRRHLLAWYAANGRELSWRRPGASTYYRIIAEVFLQRTTVAAVEGFLPRFVGRYSSWRRIAAERRQRLEEVLQPLGLQRRRAASLLQLSEAMSARGGRFPSTRGGIEALPGVGQYIANSIELFAHARSRPLLDVNMARVLERYFGPRRLADIRYDPYLQTLAARVVQGRGAQQANWALLDFAALVCRRGVPPCGSCPLRSGCRTGRSIAPTAHSP